MFAKIRLKFRRIFALRKAGWQPNRNNWSVLVHPEGFEASPVARQILSEYGGLLLEGLSGDCEFNPNECAGTLEQMKEYIEKSGISFYPIGNFVLSDPYGLMVNAEGQVYSIHPSEDIGVEFLAQNFDELLDWLVYMLRI